LNENHARNAVVEWLRNLAEKGIMDRVSEGSMRHLLNQVLRVSTSTPEDFYERCSSHEMWGKVEPTVIAMVDAAGGILECTKQVLPSIVAFQLAQLQSNNSVYGSSLKAVAKDLATDPIPEQFDRTKHQLWGACPDIVSETQTIYFVCGPYNGEMLRAEAGSYDRKLTVVSADSNCWPWQSFPKDTNCASASSVILAGQPPTSISNSGTCECCDLPFALNGDSKDVSDSAVEPAKVQAAPRNSRRSISIASLVEPNPAANITPPKQQSSISAQESAALPSRSNRRASSVAPSEPASSAASNPFNKRQRTAEKKLNEPEEKPVPVVRGKNPRAPVPAKEGNALKSEVPAAEPEATETSSGARQTGKSTKDKMVIRLPSPHKLSGSVSTQSFDPLNFSFGTPFELLIADAYYTYRALWYFQATITKNNSMTKGVVLVAHPEGWTEDLYAWVFLDEDGLKKIQRLPEKPKEMSEYAKLQATTWYDVSNSKFLELTAKSWQIGAKDLEEIKNGPWIRKGWKMAPPKRQNWPVAGQAKTVAIV
jgi:hypothetical protein